MGNPYPTREEALAQLLRDPVSLPAEYHPGYCARCGTVLTGRQRKWCANTNSCRSRGTRGELWKPTEKGVIGLDGEGIGSKYTLLATSQGDFIEDYERGLNTWQCFEFLLALPSLPLKFGFAFGYDVNMILRDLTPKQLKQLRSFHQTRFDKYYIQHIPSKKFLIKDMEKQHSVTIWDQFPFVQSSFVKWLEAFKLAPEEEIERIREMKDQRSDFANTDIDAIREYCISECRYLEWGVSHFLELYEGLGYHPSNYYSPGTLAALELHKRGVKEYVSEPPKKIAEFIDKAYYGGRAEACRVGPIQGQHWQYDINSAYPFAATMLPCLAHGKWIHARRSDPISEYGVYSVKWNVPNRQIWGPFPYRPNSGSLKFPRSGITTIWGCELLAGLPLCQDISILDGYVWEPSCNHKPFAYLQELYDYRRQLKAEGDAREYVVKLILNSTYGKLAQRKSWKGKNKDAKPTFQCIAWAGLITAKCRSMLLAELVSNGSSILMLATDSILTSKPLDLPCSKSLGDWEAKELRDIFVVGAGFYFAIDEKGNPVARTRGIRAGNVSYKDCVDAWNTAGRDGVYRVNFTRFVGYPLALARTEGYKYWRTFVSVDLNKRFSMVPRREWISANRWDGGTYPPDFSNVRKADKVDTLMREIRRGSIDHYKDAGEINRMLRALIAEETHSHPPHTELPDDQPDWIINQIGNAKVNHSWTET
jgi:hypothetical protein